MSPFNAMDEKTVKHMEFIQAVITRMSGNSFLIKGWTVTIAAALFALAGASAKPVIILIVLLPALSFWGLDAYYLRQERLFRALYNDVRLSVVKGNQAQIVEPFSLSTTKYQSQISSWFGVLWSPTVFAFHGVIVGATGLVFLITFLSSKR